MSVDPQTAPSPGIQGAQDGRPRILVTDHHVEVLRSVERGLGERYWCEFATELGQVRERLANGDFHLALCGIEMEGAPGLDLAKEIIRENPRVAVVLVTGEDDPEVAKQALDFGVYGYLAEPFWPGQLLITVMNAMRRRELEIAGRAHSRNLEERRQKIIDMAPMPIYVKDESYRYVVANLQADALAGLKEGQLVGQTDEQIMARDALEHTRAIDQRMFADGKTYDAEETLSIGGVRRAFKTIKFPLCDDAGKVTAVCGISTDITDQKEAIRLRDELAASQQQAIDELRSSYQETVDRFATAMALHDSSTGMHVNRMASVASFLGERLGLDPERVQLLRVAAPMHDVGKIAISDAILRKPGPLTPEERADMQRHAAIGHEILSGSESELLRLAAMIALTHHEHFDGSGYPQGMAGEEIPLEGRIAALADVFDALLSDRCYRPAFEMSEAIEVIKEGRGTQFDPEIVDTLLEHLDEALSLRS